VSRARVFVPLLSLSLVLFLPTPAPTDGGTTLKANLDLPFEAIGEKEEEEEAPEVIVFYGQQYEGDFFCFVADKSSSMNGAPWKKLQQECTRIITGFSERVQFAIVFFDANQVKFPPSGKPADANAAMKGAGIAMVMSTTTGHGTCSKPALQQCLSYANQSSSKRKVIIYLSDGFQTCPGFDGTTYGQECLNETTQKNTSRAHINAICIGPAGQVDEAWMRKLAAQNNGSYARVVQ